MKFNVPGPCIECGKPGLSRYGTDSDCLCTLHQRVSGLVHSVVDDCLRYEIPKADAEALELARTRLLRRPGSLVKLKAITARLRRLQREGAAARQ